MENFIFCAVLLHERRCWPYKIYTILTTKGVGCILQISRSKFFYSFNAVIPVYADSEQFVGNKAKGRISKRVFQENKARQIFRKANISNPLIRTRTIEIRPFALLPTMYFVFKKNLVEFRSICCNQVRIYGDEHDFFAGF